MINTVLLQDIPLTGSVKRRAEADDKVAEQLFFHEDGSS